MKIRKTIIFLLIFFSLLGMVGCASPKGDLPEQKPDPSGVVKEDQPENEPQVEIRSGDLIPDGVLINTENQVSLIYLDVTGQMVSEIQTPGIGSADPENTVIAGPVNPGQPFPPVIYRSWNPEQVLMANINGQTSPLRQTDAFFSITAAPGQSALAFSEVRINEDNFPHAFLFSGTPDNLGAIDSFYDLVDAPTYWAIKPVGIETTASQAQAVWYTKSAWGIGGADLIYPITKGLYLYDLTNGDNLQYVDDDRSFQGISPDLTFAGTVIGNASGTVSISVINLSSSQQINFDLDPSTDRGAGHFVFSPDNRFAAWLEASGSMISDPYDFHPRVRVGDINNGGVIGALEDSKAVQAINSSMVTFMKPVGWLDNVTLLVETRGENWEDVNLLRFDVLSSTVSVFASGNFVTFGYQ